MKIFQRVIAVGILASLSCACVYRINIQQGNFLDQAAVDQVKDGMTRSQVRYLLGTPLASARMIFRSAPQFAPATGRPHRVTRRRRANGRASTQSIRTESRDGRCDAATLNRPLEMV